MPTFLTPRRWQKQLQKGTLKRNSTAMKPAVWFLQRIMLREIRERQSARLQREYAMDLLR